MACISYRQSVNSKAIKSVAMLSQSGFWLKSVQSDTSECLTLPDMFHTDVMILGL